VSFVAVLCEGSSGWSIEEHVLPALLQHALPCTGLRVAVVPMNDKGELLADCGSRAHDLLTNGLPGQPVTAKSVCAVVILWDLHPAWGDEASVADDRAAAKKSLLNPIVDKKTLQVAKSLWKDPRIGLVCVDSEFEEFLLLHDAAKDGYEAEFAQTPEQSISIRHPQRRAENKDPVRRFKDIARKLEPRGMKSFLSKVVSKVSCDELSEAHPDFKRLTNTVKSLENVCCKKPVPKTSSKRTRTKPRGKPI
jgi:hypothetical protein